MKNVPINQIVFSKIFDYRSHAAQGGYGLLRIQSKYGYYINYVAVTACIVVVSIIVQTWWFNRDSNSEKLPQSNPLPPPPEDPRDRFIRPNEDKDNS